MGCTFLGVIDLAGGTCAQWFSGSVSALAVAVAVGAHFYTAWRQRKTEERDDSIEIAGVSMVLRNVLGEAESNARMFRDACRTVSVWDVKYTLSKRLAAVRADKIPLLDKQQAEVLLRHDAGGLAARINLLISQLNITNTGIEDYSNIRIDLYQEMSRYQFAIESYEDHLDPHADEVKRLLRKLRATSKAADHFVQYTGMLFEKAVKLAEAFNIFCAECNWSRYAVDTETYKKIEHGKAPAAGGLT